MTPARSNISRVITEPLGGSSLSQAVQAGRLPSSIQPSQPSDPDAWRRHVSATEVPQWLTALAPAFQATGAAQERLQRASEKGVVVTTGQQAGLFGGPLYTLAKAMSARALADVLEEELGIPVAPVFWAATDDADFLEASVVHLADAEGLHEVRVATKPPAGTIMAHAPLGDTRPLLKSLRAACGSAAHAAFLEHAQDAFAKGKTLGGAYVELMRRLLEPLGVAVLDSSHEAYRAAARPVLQRALTNASAVASALGEVAALIRESGFEPQVQDERGLSLVFEISKGVKRRLSVEEAAGAARGGAALAPNVLLRPVVERAILPTVAYVAGPGELAYFAQSNAVADTLNLPRVVGLPRWSGTIVEPFAQRALDRLGLDWSEIRNLHAVERRLAQQAMPAEITAAWKRLREDTDVRVRGVGDAVRGADLMPDAVIEGLRRSLQHRLERGERRLLAAAKRRDAKMRHDLAVASAALFPMGSRQERVLNFIPMLARGGNQLIDSLQAAAAAHAAALVRSARPASTAV